MDLSHVVLSTKCTQVNKIKHQSRTTYTEFGDFTKEILFLQNTYFFFFFVKYEAVPISDKTQVFVLSTLVSIRQKLQLSPDLLHNLAMRNITISSYLRTNLYYNFSPSCFPIFLLGSSSCMSKQYEQRVLQIHLNRTKFKRHGSQDSPFYHYRQNIKYF